MRLVHTFIPHEKFVSTCGASGRMELSVALPTPPE
jgi:hypothetical protein